MQGEFLWEVLTKWASGGVRKRKTAVSPPTIKFHKIFARLYFKFLDGRPHTADTSNEFLQAGASGSLTGRLWKDGTKRGYSKDLIAFTRWAKWRRYIEEDFSEYIEKPSEKKRQIHIVSTEKIKQIIMELTEAQPDHDKRQKRIRENWRFYLMTLLHLALRRSEPFTISPDKVHLDSPLPSVTVTRKGGGEQEMAITDPYLLEQFRKRKNDKILFDVSVDVLEEKFRELRKRGDVPLDFSLHKIRHSVASEMLAKGASLTLVSKFLGHSDIKTTLKYYVQHSIVEITRMLKTYNSLYMEGNDGSEAIDTVDSLLKSCGILNNVNVNTILSRDTKSGELTLRITPKTQTQ